MQLFMPPGSGRYLSTPQLIGGFAWVLAYPVVMKIVRKKNPDIDREEAKKLTGGLCACGALLTIGVMLFILHI